MKLYLVNNSQFVIAESFSNLKEAYPKARIARIDAKFIGLKPIEKPTKTSIKNRQKPTLNSYDEAKVIYLLSTIYDGFGSLTYGTLVKGLKQKFKMSLNAIQRKNGAIHQLIERGILEKNGTNYIFTFSDASALPKVAKNEAVTKVKLPCFK